MPINYQYLIDEAMLEIVRKVLLEVQDYGLSTDRCLYISFYTNHPSVILSKKVKQSYPKEITIVLQHQFKNLQVKKGKFSVNLAFHGIPETIEVPFSALTGFADPLENFSIQFKNNDSESHEKLTKSSSPSIDANNHFIEKEKNKDIEHNASIEEKKPGEIIEIDKFRKKNK